MNLTLPAASGDRRSTGELFGRTIAWIARRRVSTRAATRPISPARLTWTLNKAATHSIFHPMGMRIECLAGCLWLTHDGDPRDVVLQAPATHLADRDSRLLIHALDDAKVRVSRSDSQQNSPAPRWTLDRRDSRKLDWFASVMPEAVTAFVSASV
jgi:hypothetical protein